MREKFKEYERNVTPDEHLLESLEKYGQQAREVQLTLQHLGPSLGDWTNRPRAPLRQAEGGGRVRRGSGVTGQHRQSLPPLSRLRLHSEPLPEEVKRPKRKSLTLVEEAWGWLESLGKGGKQQLGRDKGKSKEDDEGDGRGDKGHKIPLASGEPQGRDKKNKTNENQSLISCLGKHRRAENGKDNGTRGRTEAGKHKRPQAGGTQPPEISIKAERDELADLRRLTVQQQAALRELQLRTESTDGQISELKRQLTESQRSSKPSEDEEQLEFWLNELKAEEGHEKDLQRQFLELKEKVAECKNKLEEYKHKLQPEDLQNPRTALDTLELEGASKISESVAEGEAAVDGLHGDGKKTVITRVEPKLPYILVSSSQITEAQLSGPSELRQWWTRWTEAQKPKSRSTSKVLHRSEITIHLGSTRV